MKWGEHVSTPLDKKAAPPVRLARPRLRLMRRRCHTDHTYCRLVLFLNVFPRLSEHTHVRAHSHTHTHSCIDVQVFISAALASLSQSKAPWRLVVLSISGKLPEDTFCGGEFLKVVQNLLALAGLGSVRRIFFFSFQTLINKRSSNKSGIKGIELLVLFLNPTI